MGPSGWRAFRGRRASRIHVEHPAYASQIWYAATTDRPASELQLLAGRCGPPATRGDRSAGIRLRSTRRVAARTVFADTGQPAPKVRVCAASGPSESPVYGISDAEGRLPLRLTPGDHSILADPTDGGAACVRTHTALRVADQPAEQASRSG